MPALTREALSGAGDAVRRRTVATIAFLGAPAAAGAALVAPGLLSVLFGAELPGRGAAACACWPRRWCRSS